MSLNHGVLHKTKRDRLFDLLQDMKWHPHYRLKEAGGVRYSARLLELKRLGYKIDSEEIDGVGGKQYRLCSLRRTSPQEKHVKVFLTEHDAAEMIGTLGRVTSTAEDAVISALNSFRINKNKL